MRILVVEDETNVIDFIEQGLKEEGYMVDVATDGELALEFAQTYPYDLIILDIAAKAGWPPGCLHPAGQGKQHAHSHADRP